MEAWKSFWLRVLPDFYNTSVISRETVVFVDDAFWSDIQDAIAGAFDLVITLDAGDIFGDKFANGRALHSYVMFSAWLLMIT